ncbi:MAG: hypothetical protein NWE98_07705 [Candidatus Bathyarchaeota archaeon]|nr:hypothetical protein [Candidatus Bathyarchaeota archaeon]
MTQPLFTCPFCDAPPWRTRYMLWKHMHECLRKKQQTYNAASDLRHEELTVISAANKS